MAAAEEVVSLLSDEEEAQAAGGISENYTRQLSALRRRLPRGLNRPPAGCRRRAGGQAPACTGACDGRHGLPARHNGHGG